MPRFHYLMLSFILISGPLFAWSGGKKQRLEDSISINQTRKQFDKAAQFSQRKVNRVRKKKGNSSPEYAAALQQLAEIQLQLDQPNEAEINLKVSLDIRKNLFGEIHFEVAQTSFLIGEASFLKNDFQNTVVWYRKALDIFQKLPVEVPERKARILQNLGNVCTRLGRFAESEDAYRKAIEIREKLEGKEKRQLANIYNGLGALYYETGDFQAAEENYQKASAIWTKDLGEKHINLIYVNNNLANLYVQLGNYVKAGIHYQKSLEILKENYDEIHPDVVSANNNLGVMYFEMKDFAKAEYHFLKGLEIKEKLAGKPDLEVAGLLVNLGSFYFLNGMFSKAEAKYVDFIEIYKSLKLDDHPDVAEGYENLAGVYFRKREYAKSDSFYAKALEMYTRQYGKSNPHLATTYHRLAVLDLASGNLAKAETHFSMYQQREMEMLHQYFPFLSDLDKEKYVEKKQVYLDVFKAFCLKRYASNPAIAGDLFNLQMATKSLLLQQSAKWRNQVRSLGDSVVNDLFIRWNQSHIAMYQLLQSPDSTLRSGVDSMILKTEYLEKELSRRSAIFSSVGIRNSSTWREVQKTLKPGEAVVEIIRINQFGNSEIITDSSGSQPVTYNVPGLTDTICYAVLVLKPDSPFPELLVLENGNELENNGLKQFRSSIKRQKQDIISYSYFWEKINEKLADVQIIYLSSDGVFHKINVNTLWNPKTKKYLLDEKEVRLVTTSKDLLDRPDQHSSNHSACLIGFPSYYPVSESKMDDKDPQVQPFTNYNYKEDLIKLPESKVEVEKIGALLLAQGWKIQRLIGENATEDSIKKLRSPGLLHVATHGFFRPDSGANLSPLLRSGLMLAGAGFNHPSNPGNSAEDGILTSLEAMNLNLDKTDLVVLSACETGLGEVKNGEGVYGLQRAFKVAGARSVIMSLWKVSDKATQELMVAFYKNWLRGTQTNNGGLKGKRKKAVVVQSNPFWQDAGSRKRSAFLAAQKELKAKYPNPYYWGAFVLVGD